METIELLEYLANNVDYKLDIEHLICSQSLEIQNAFKTNNVSLIKTKLGGITKLADRNTIFTL